MWHNRCRPSLRGEFGALCFHHLSRMHRTMPCCTFLVMMLELLSLVGPGWSQHCSLPVASPFLFFCRAPCAPTRRLIDALHCSTTYYGTLCIFSSRRAADSNHRVGSMEYFDFDRSKPSMALCGGGPDHSERNLRTITHTRPVGFG